MATGIELRSYAFLDSLQPQYAAFLGTVAKGFLPLAYDASLWVEVAPGIEINRLTDIALKATKVWPGMQIIERYFGVLELHSPDQAETRAAGEAILDAIGLTEQDRIKPNLLSSQIIRRIDDHHAQLVNRDRHGHMIIPGQTLYVLECEPAVYSALAANEAEKNSPITLVDCRTYGAVGRLYIAGRPADVARGAEAAQAAVRQLSGKQD